LTTLSISHRFFIFDLLIRITFGTVQVATDSVAGSTEGVADIIQALQYKLKAKSSDIKGRDARLGLREVKRVDEEHEMLIRGGYGMT
jgi:hypothetical protein